MCAQEVSSFFLVSFVFNQTFGGFCASGASKIRVVKISIQSLKFFATNEPLGIQKTHGLKFSTIPLKFFLPSKLYGI